MIKIVLFVVLVLQAFSVERKAVLHYNDELILRNPASGTNISAQLKSLPGNDVSIPIEVQLRQISDLTNPLQSTVLLTQTCIFNNKSCTLKFTFPTINSAHRYTIRLAQSTSIHNVQLKLISQNSQTKQKKQNQQGNFRIALSPLGAANPGFRFYLASAGTWKLTFAVLSSPAPTISSFDFKLWSLTSNQLGAAQLSTQSSTTVGSVSFSISTPGYYYLSTGITVSSINALTKYPIDLQFTFTDDICPSGQFLDKSSGSCSACNSITNASGTTTVSGVCDCATNYFWKDNSCQACPTSGCPTNPPTHPPNNQNNGNRNVRTQGNQGHRGGRH